MELLKNEERCYLGIDIGGTWLKGGALIVNTESPKNSPVIYDDMYRTARVKSPLSEKATVDDFIDSVQQLIEELGLRNKKLKGVGISTPGIVDYKGQLVLKAAA